MELQSPDSNIKKIKDGGGTQGIYSKVPEYEVTLKVCNKIKVLLEANNINVIMTKTKIEENPGNIERANVGYGKEISDISTQYGKIILENLVSTVGMNNRGISTRDDITGFNWSRVPVILVEMGFMSNPTEDKLLVNDEY